MHPQNVYATGMGSFGLAPDAVLAGKSEKDA
jgi:hypothetical protein